MSVWFVLLCIGFLSKALVLIHEGLSHSVSCIALEARSLQRESDKVSVVLYCACMGRDRIDRDEVSGSYDCVCPLDHIIYECHVSYRVYDKADKKYVACDIHVCEATEDGVGEDPLYMIKMNLVCLGKSRLDARKVGYEIVSVEM
jgi:hypothetical protein